MNKIIGHVAVDSGQIMVGDPCYLEDWKGHEFGDSKPGEYSYAGACTATLSDEGYGELNFNGGHAGAAVAVGTLYGDGTYPVIGTFNSAGRLTSITVDFSVDPFGDAEDEVMDECERCGDAVEMGWTTDGLCETCASHEENEEEDA